jgi:cation diffusion facilitator family transporter
MPSHGTVEITSKGPSGYAGGFLACLGCFPPPTFLEGGNLLATETKDSTRPFEESQRGAWVGIITYIVLSTAKLTVGWLSGSRAVTADGWNNLTDVIGSVTALMGLRIAVLPADEEHRYGHRKAETVATLVVATIMGMVGLDVGLSAASAVFSHNLQAPNPLSAWVGAASTVIMLIVYTYNMRLARRTGSKALEAAAYDHLSDAVTSVSTVVGVLGARWGWYWLDPLAGVIVAAIIIRTAFHIGLEAAHTLMDGFDTKGLRDLRQRVGNVQGVLKVRDLRARYLGNAVAVDVTIAVHRSLSLVEAHRVSDRVEAALQGFLGVESVLVHVEPQA